MFEKGQRIEVSVTDAADGQKCFGKLPEGLAVFVDGPVAVGDRVSAEIRKVKKNYLEARLLDVIEKSPSRVDQPCAHFGVCGGCKWQHVDYTEQLRIKRKLVEDALHHLGGFTDFVVEPTRPSPRIYGYRNKIEFSFGDRRFLLAEEMDAELDAPEKPLNYALGFHAAGRYDKVLDIDRCHIATDEMNEVLARTKSFFLERHPSVYSTKLHEGLLRNLVIRKAFATGEFMVNLVTSWHDEKLMADYRDRLLSALGHRLTTLVNSVTSRRNAVARGEKQVVLHGPGIITEKIGDLRFVISPDSFFQTNTAQAECLYGVARDMAELQDRDIVYDLYCGIGTITLFLAGHCQKVIGFEMEEAALADAEVNARLNNVSNCAFHKIDMKHFDSLARTIAQGEQPDVVITDPPRAGMHPKVVAALRELKPRRIVYVSCNPASLARDVKMLCEDGAYGLKIVQPVDLFPHTYHVESVARLDRAS